MKMKLSGLFVLIAIPIALAPMCQDGRINPTSMKGASLAQGKEIKGEVIGVHQGGIISMTVSPDGNTLITSGVERSTCGWDLRGKKKLWQWHDGEQQKSSIGFVPNGKWFFAAGDGSPIDVRKPSDWKIERELKEHGREFVVGFAVSSDSSILYSCDFHKIRAWSLTDWKNVATFDGPNFTHATKLSRDNNILFVAGREELWAIDVKTGKRLRSVEAHGYKPDGITVTNVSIDGLDVSPAKPMIATGGCDSKVILWNPETFEKLRVLEGNAEGVSEVAFTSDGKHILACGGKANRQPGDLCAWDVETGRLIFRVKATDGGPLTSLVIVPQDRTVIVAGYGGQIVAYDLPKVLGKK